MIGPTIVNLLLLVWSPCLAIREIPLTQGTVDKLILHANETVKLVSKEEHKASDVFWTFEAHTQDNDDHISLSRDYKETVDKRKIQVGNHKGLVVFPEENVTKSTAFLKNERLDRSIDLIILFRGNYRSIFNVGDFLSTMYSQVIPRNTQYLVVTLISHQPQTVSV